jgi:hydroxyacylglutathione hydrolase
MYRALDKASKLPGATRVYCGHEYSVANLLFAVRAEPDNLEARHKLLWAQQQRSRGLATIPSSIDEERAYNPFMRCALNVSRPELSLPPDADAVQVMHALRELKNKS